MKYAPDSTSIDFTLLRALGLYSSIDDLLQQAMQVCFSLSIILVTIKFNCELSLDSSVCTGLQFFYNILSPQIYNMQMMYL